MPDVTPLLTAVDRLADRLRAMPLSTLRRGAAAEGLALARELALRAQRLEFPGRQPREMPDAGVFAVGDQVAVAGHELAEALRGLGDRTAGRERAVTEPPPGSAAAPPHGPGADQDARPADAVADAVALVLAAEVRARR